MSLIGNGKTDVDERLSLHRKTHLFLVDSPTQPDATGFSGDEAADADGSARPSGSVSNSRAVMERSSNAATHDAGVALRPTTSPANEEPR
jgi:hypothetical protein